MSQQKHWVNARVAVRRLTGSILSVPLFSEIAAHLTTMGEFIVNAGPRDAEICALE